jgi:hypothetical protein
VKVLTADDAQVSGRQPGELAATNCGASQRCEAREEGAS